MKLIRECVLPYFKKEGIGCSAGANKVITDILVDEEPYHVEIIDGKSFLAIIYTELVITEPCERIEKEIQKFLMDSLGKTVMDDDGEVSYCFEVSIPEKTMTPEQFENHFILSLKFARRIQELVRRIVHHGMSLEEALEFDQENASKGLNELEQQSKSEEDAQQSRLNAINPRLRSELEELLAKTSFGENTRVRRGKNKATGKNKSYIELSNGCKVKLIRRPKCLRPTTQILNHLSAAILSQSIRHSESQDVGAIVDTVLDEVRFVVNHMGDGFQASVLTGIIYEKTVAKLLRRTRLKEMRSKDKAKDNHTTKEIGDKESQS